MTPPPSTTRFWLSQCVPLGVLAAVASAIPGQIDHALTSLPSSVAALISELVALLCLPGGMLAVVVSHNPHVDTTSFPYPALTFFASGLCWGTLLFGLRSVFRMMRPSPARG